MADPGALQVPSASPATAFGTTGQIEEPMRNFGYTVAAYALLWCVLIAFVVLTHLRQRALRQKVDELERALRSKEGC